MGSFLAPNWEHRIKITIPSSLIDSALSHYPVPIFITSSSGTGAKDIATPIFTEVGNESKKIAVTKSDGTTQIYAEIEKWSYDSGTVANSIGVLHVSKSDLELSSSSNTDLYIYYDANASDNTTYVGDIGSSAGESVWDSNYLFVYHLADATTSTVLDSTSNSRDGTKTGAGEPAISTGEFSEYAQDFDGTDDEITVDVSGGAAIGSQSNITIEGRWYSESTGSEVSRHIVGANYSSGDNDGRYWQFWHESEDRGKTVHGSLYINGTRYVMPSTDGFDIEAWHYGALRYNSGNAITITVDETKYTDDETPSGTVDQIDALRIGNNPYISGREWYGKISEIRVSSAHKSDAWVKATYYALDDALASYGDEEEPPTTSIKAINGVAYANIKAINGIAIGDIKQFNGVSNVS